MTWKQKPRSQIPQSWRTVPKKLHAESKGNARAEITKKAVAEQTLNNTDTQNDKDTEQDSRQNDATTTVPIEKRGRKLSSIILRDKI